MTERLEQLARTIAAAAASRGIRIVLAESCTAGLVAQSLSRVPGASQWLCGSAVVYQNETKTAWLHVGASQLADPAVGPVSARTAADMCAGVLRITPHADLAASITGHLGPDAPAELDGLVFVGTQSRDAWRTGEPASVTSARLTAELPADAASLTLRQYRQQTAAELVLQRLVAILNA